MRLLYFTLLYDTRVVDFQSASCLTDIYEIGLKEDHINVHFEGKEEEKGKEECFDWRPVGQSNKLINTINLRCLYSTENFIQYLS